MRHLTTRIARIQSSCPFSSDTFFKTAFLLIFGFAAYSFGDGNARPGPRVVEAEAFVLRGKDGIKRGEFAIDPNGETFLQLNDLKGEPRVSLDCTRDRNGFRVFDGAGKTRIALSMQENGEISMEFGDANQTPTFGIVTREDRSGATLVFPDENGKVQMGLGVLTTGEVGLDIRGKEDKGRVTLKVQPNGTAALRVRADQPKATSSIVAYPGGDNGFEVLDSEGRLRIGTKMLKDGQAYLGMINQNNMDQIRLFMAPGGEAGLYIRDSQGVGGVRLDTRPGDAQSICIEEERDKPLMLIGRRNGLVQMFFLEKNQLPKLTLP